MKQRGKSKSIFRTILFSVLAVLIIEIVLLVSALNLSRVGPELDNNAVEILKKQVENRQNYLEALMQENQKLSDLSDKIDETFLELEEKGKIQLEILAESSKNSLPLLSAVSEDLISAMRSKNITGIFLILNTQGLETCKKGSSLPGIYLRDLEPGAAASQKNSDLLLERCPIELVRTMGISTDKGWKPMFEYDRAEKEGFFYWPFQQAWNDGCSLDEDEYGHWSTSLYTLKGDSREAMAYTIPLILPDGRLYGVLGIEMLTSYMETLLPSLELENGGYGTYFLANAVQSMEEESLKIWPVCTSAGEPAPKETASSLTIRKVKKGEYQVWLDGQMCKGAAVGLEFYSRYAPFYGEKWMLIGVVPEEKLFAFSQKIIYMLAVSIAVTMVIGLVGSILVSHHLAKPVLKLSEEVEEAQKTRSDSISLSKTGIRELDQFAGAITQLSQDIVHTSTKFLRIMDMASVELGGYEILGDAEEVYTTENFFAMLGLERDPKMPMTGAEFRKLLEEFDEKCPCVYGPDGMKVYQIFGQGDHFRYVRLEINVQEQMQIGLAEDVTAVTVERLRIEHERDYDALTGLYNRRAFQRELEKLFQRPEKLGHAAFLMLDMDNLKKTNDTYGHDWGDDYIRTAGRCFGAHAPKSSLCSRISGDEFNLFFYGYESQDAIREAFGELKAQLEKQVIILPNGRKMALSISGGVSWYPENSTDPAELKKYADFAMYRVKKTQKGEFGEFDLALYNQADYTTQVRREFHKVVDESLLKYHFQPIISAVTGETEAYEALMRVRMPHVNSPDIVMRLAREENCLHEIERITLFEASRTYAALEEQGLVKKGKLLFLNSIASECLSDEEYREYYQKFQRLLGQLVVEITEEESMSLEAMEVKRNAPGFTGTFALDDYGSGYSNEKNLLELSPGYIKVDMSLIRHIDADTDKQQMVSNIVNYAHQRSMKIVAEGIETEEELRKVLELGADLLQGFFLARPSEVPKAVSEQAEAVIEEMRIQNKNVT